MSESFRALSRAAVAAALVALVAGEAPLLGQPDSRPLFEDRASQSGLLFSHFNGMTGKYWLVEIMGSGTGLFDYDNDGDLDAYLVQGGMPNPAEPLADALSPPPPEALPLRDRLFRNDSYTGDDGSTVLVFSDVTINSGIVADHYGMGIATGDFDGDGWTDLYVTNFGPNQLLRNNGDGTFTDVTDAAGAGDVRWGVSSTFVDFDADGWLDLYVGNYLDQRFRSGSSCTSSTGAPDYCGPLAYRPQPDRFLRNRGDGTFEDHSQPAGILDEVGGALGVVATDLNGDGRIDLYVANDMTPNHLRINQGDGTFVNDAVFSGAAVNWEGKPEASMGVDASDFDGDGDDDLFMVHITGETNTLYVNDGTGIFDDVTVTSGLGNASWVSTGFGTGWIDVDQDGMLDLFIANGAVRVIEELVQRRDPYPVHQRNQLFRNLGGGRFEEITDAGEVFELSEVSRGAAFGDVDNDGDTDILLNNNQGPARLFVNDPPGGRPWLGLAQGVHSPAVDWRARVETKSGRILWRRARRDGSYASARDPRVRVALGVEDTAAAVLLTRPGGAPLRWTGPRERRYVVWPHPDRGPVRR